MATGVPAEFQLSTAISETDQVGFHWIISDEHGKLVERSAEAFDTDDEAQTAGQSTLEQLQAAPD